MLSRYFGLHVRGCSESFQRIVSQPVGSCLTIMVIALALGLPASLRIVVNNAEILSSTWEGAADFTIYLKLDVSDDAAAAFAESVRELPEVASVELVDRTAALAEFRARSGFGAALDALDDNPLPNTLVVRPAGGAQADIGMLADALAERAETDIVQIDSEWVARLRGILLLLARVVDIVGVLVGLAVVLVIGNTIRLEINNRSTEIEVMKLVGGTDGFIRRPFLYLGAWYGLLGALAAAVLVATALALLRGPVGALADLYASTYRPSALNALETLVLIASGAALGWAGAWLASARHLRAIEPA
jgi:cell division transport system permease protein